jgi:hypothetical protein
MDNAQISPHEVQINKIIDLFCKEVKEINFEINNPPYQRGGLRQKLQIDGAYPTPARPGRRMEKLIAGKSAVGNNTLYELNRILKTAPLDKRVELENKAIDKLEGQYLKEQRKEMFLERIQEKPLDKSMDYAARLISVRKSMTEREHRQVKEAGKNRDIAFIENKNQIQGKSTQEKEPVARNKSLRDKLKEDFSDSKEVKIESRSLENSMMKIIGYDFTKQITPIEKMPDK